MDILRTKGIYKNGFGTVPKLMLFDNRITVGPKGLYCYLCSYAGSGEIAFPYRSRICDELKISVKTYQSYIRELVKNDYISVEQKKKNNKYSYNVYTIANTIKKEAAKSIIKSSALLKRVAEDLDCYDEHVDIDIAGYGKIPKMITTDNSVNIKSKVVYGLISAHYANGYKKLNTKDAIKALSISEDTYYKSLKELEETEFLKRREMKTKSGYKKQVLIINPEKEIRDEFEEEERSCCDMN